MSKPDTGAKVLAQNRKAYHDYEILDTVEAGLSLWGSEVKSMKAGNVSLQGGYAAIHHNEAFLYSVNVAPFEQANRQNHDPLRPRKLLLKKKEIRKLFGEVQTQGVTLVPLKLLERRGLIKLVLGLAKGKKHYDKRHALKQRDENREIDRSVKNYKGRIG